MVVLNSDLAKEHGGSTLLSLDALVVLRDWHSCLKAERWRQQCFDPSALTRQLLLPVYLPGLSARRLKSLKIYG